MNFVTSRLDAACGIYDEASGYCTAQTYMLNKLGYYCDTTKTQCGCTTGLGNVAQAEKLFFGRGAINLSWNYNYYSVSMALLGDD